MVSGSHVVLQTIVSGQPLYRATEILLSPHLPLCLLGFWVVMLLGTRPPTEFTVANARKARAVEVTIHPKLEGPYVHV